MDFKRILFVCMIIFVIVGSFLYITEINKNLKIRKEAIEEYLYNKKDYTTNEIKNIGVDYRFDRRLFGYEPFIISVIFNNEPDVIYYFGFYKNVNEIKLIGAGGIGANNHRLIHESHFKHE